jgi:hypothetical protein
MDMNFKTFYHLKENKLSNVRQPMLKINQMNPKQFVAFLTTLREHVKGGQLDLGNIDVTEKIDGMSLKIAYHDGKVKMESAHSGLKEKPSEFKGAFSKPFVTTFTHLNKNFKKKIGDIAKKHGDFKVQGEYLYTQDAPIDADGTVTFIATKYDPKKLGSLGTFVIFNVYMFDEESGTFIPALTDQHHAILKAFSKLSTKELKFFKKTDIKWSGSLNLTYSIDNDRLEDILSDPSFLSDKKNKEVFETVRAQIDEVFQRAVEQRGSVLGIPSSVVEGIVLKFADGSSIGAQNPEWKKLKNELFDIPDRINDAVKNFTQKLTGYRAKKKVLEILNDPSKRDEINDKYNSMIGAKFSREISTIANDWQRIRDGGELPKNIIATQGCFIECRLAAYASLTDVQSLINTLTAY